MSVINKELYDALLEAKVSDDKNHQSGDLRYGC